MDNYIKQSILSKVNDVSVDNLFFHINKNEISLQEMKDHGLMQSKIEEIESLLNKKTSDDEVLSSKEGILKDLHDNNLTLATICNYYEQDLLSENDIIDFGGPEFPRKIRYLINRPPANFKDWKDLPPLQANKTDVFFLGEPGSGKSCILASLFLYSRNKGLSIISNDSGTGTNYSNTLTQDLKNGVLPYRTASDGVNYIPINLKHPEYNNFLIPLNFIEMSGEKLDETYEVGITKNSIGAKDYLNNNNKKIILFIVDYFNHMESVNNHDGTSIDQDLKLEKALGLLDSNGTLDNTDAIYLIVTKADLFPDGVDSYDYARQFIDGNYTNLVSNLETIRDNHNGSFDLVCMPYSIGNVQDKIIISKADETYPAELLNCICNDAHGKKTNSGGIKNVFKNLFK